MRNPSPAPANLSVTRGTDNDGCCMVARWGNPADALRESDHKWTGLDATWWFRASKNMSSKITQQRGSGHPTGDVVWVRDQGIHETETVYYNRAAYHPRNAGRYLTAVEAYVYAFNGKSSLAGGTGNTRNTAGVRMTYRFQKPRAPQWADPSMDASSGRVSCKVTTDEGKDERERYDTLYRVLRQDSADRGNSFKSAQVVVGWTSTTDKEATPHYDVADAQRVLPGQWVRVTFEAKARGLAGDSATVSRQFVVAYPAQASVQRVTATSLDPDGVVTVHLATNQASTAPVESVQLQRCKGDFATAQEASEGGSWSDVAGARDNGLCTGLSDLVADALPERGERTWYRVLSKNGTLSRHSQPFEASVLFRAAPTAADDAVAVVSALSGADGESVAVVLGHAADDSTGTQIAWSANADAWESTEQPSTYDLPDAGWEDAESRAEGYERTAYAVIRGLQEGAPCYVRARRYLDKANGTREYGPWGYAPDQSYPVLPSVAPSDVRLSAPDAVARGSELAVTWTYGGGSQQAAWNLYRVTGEGASGRVLLASGLDSSQGATVPADAIAGLEEVALCVSVTTGGEWAESPAATVAVADPPELVVAVSETLRAQPMRLFCQSTSADAALSVKVTARGCAGDTPAGRSEQLEGDVVWSSLERPDWADGGGSFLATVVLPDGLDFRNLAEYDVTVSARDSSTGLESGERAARVGVFWAHMAQLPQSCEVSADADARCVVVTPGKPFNWREGDVFDVYRVTPDGPRLIAGGQPFGVSVVDQFAPYSRDGGRVRVSVRTPDGHEEWADYPYEMACGGLRVDWDGKHVDLPYNVAASDSYEKDFEARQHLDGSRSGYWNAGRGRTASLSTDLVRLGSAEDRRLVRELAAFAGPAFVRLPDGCAYQANVDVGGLEWTHAGGAVAVSLSATEVKLTEDFMARVDDIVLPDGYDGDAGAPARSQVLYWGGEAPEPGDVLPLNEEPGGAVSVTLQASADGYANVFPVPCASESRSVTLGAFGADLEAFLAVVAATPFPQYLLTATYPIGG